MPRPDAESGRPSTPGDAGPSAAADAVRQFSHDVISPLMSVLALSEVLLLESRQDDRLNEDLRRIHAAAEEAIGMVRALSARVGASQTRE